MILDEFGERMSQLIRVLASSQREAIVAVASQVEATVVAAIACLPWGAITPVFWCRTSTTGLAGVCC